MLVIVLIVNLLILIHGHYVPGFYWRDFDGSIPADAVKAGKDVNNRSTYVGQVYATFLIPAKIYENDKKAYYEYGGQEFNVTENIKILCTQNPEEFEWVQTDNNHINTITDKYLVIGGYEPGCTTYIGRARINGEVVVGKALADNHPDNAGLHATLKGAKFHKTSFEVLSFNPKLTIDVRNGS